MTVTYPCPGQCGREIVHHLFVCGPCWRRLPSNLRRAVGSNRRDPNREALGEAKLWFLSRVGGQ